MVHEHAKAGSKSLRLCFPVLQGGDRCHHEACSRGPAPRSAPPVPPRAPPAAARGVIARGHFFQALQESERLDGLAQAHVVGKAAVQPVLGQERKPAEADALVVAERALEPLGGAASANAAGAASAREISAARASSMGGCGTSPCRRAAPSEVAAGHAGDALGRVQQADDLPQLFRLLRADVDDAVAVPHEAVGEQRVAEIHAGKIQVLPRAHGEVEPVDPAGDPDLQRGTRAGQPVGRVPDAQPDAAGQQVLAERLQELRHAGPEAPLPQASHGL